MFMKKFLYWFLGEKGGRVAHAQIGYFLTGKKLEEGGQIALETSKQAYIDLEAEIVLMEGDVAKVTAAVKEAEGILLEKTNEFNTFIKTAEAHIKRGENSKAKDILKQAAVVKEGLGAIEASVAKAQQQRQYVHDSLRDHQEELVHLKSLIANQATQHRINEALARVSAISGSYNAGGAKATIAEAGQAIERRGYMEESKTELMERPADKLLKDSRLLALEDSAEDMLAALTAGEPVKLLEQGK